MVKKTFDEFLDAVEPILEAGQVNINCGKYEGEDFVIFDSWADLEYTVAYINGFEGLKNGIPYINDRDSLADLITAAKKNVELNPDHWGYKRELEKLTTYLLYKQHVATLGHTPISLNDYEMEVGFSDEYDRCCNCGAILRTSPDSYCWVAPLFVECEGYACDDCVAKGEFDDYVMEEYCNKNKCLPEAIDLDRISLVKVNKDSFENGMHEGMNDSPAPIIEALNSEGIDVWFKVYPSQFYCEFDVYVRKEDLERAIPLLGKTDTYQGFDGAENLKKCLAQASINSAKDPDGNIRYTKCDASTGTVETRLVSPEEFINGIKD
jgi:hypothetical protein